MVDIEFEEKQAGLRELIRKHWKFLKELRDRIRFKNKVECQDKLLLEIALDCCNKDYITTNHEMFNILLEWYKNRVVKMKDDPYILSHLEEDQYYELLTFGSEIEELYYDESWKYYYY